jgi:hypothetical protein
MAVIALAADAAHLEAVASTGVLPLEVVDREGGDVSA